MEQPSEDFIDIIIILAREVALKQIRKINNIDNSKYVLKKEIKATFIECLESDSDKVVSCLLYLMINGTFVVIKSYSMRLLARLFMKKEYLLELLSDGTVNALKVETVKLVKITPTPDLYHIIANLANYLLPRGLWKELESIIEDAMIDVTSPFNQYAATLQQEVLSKYEMKLEEIKAGGLTDDQYRSFMPQLLEKISHMDGSRKEGEFMEKIIDNLVNIYMDDYPEWMQELIQPIIDMLIKMLDRNREKLFLTKSIKSVVVHFLLLIAQNDAQELTDSHLERIINHLYEWLIQVDQVSLEEWTDNYYTAYNNVANLNYNEEQDSDINNDNYDGQLVDAESAFERFVSALGQSVEESVFKRKNCRFLITNIPVQFPLFLKTVLKFVNDENIKVRWASLQCLVELSIYKEFIYLSKIQSNQIVMMEKPSEDFVDIVIKLAREDTKKQITLKNDTNNTYKYIVKRVTKQSYKECYEPNQVVSWLLYLMIKATFEIIKQKSFQLLFRLVKKAYFLESLSKEIVEVVKVETIELLKTDLTSSSSTRYHVFYHLLGIIKSLAIYLLPRGGWDGFESSLNAIIDGEEEGQNSQLQYNTRALLMLLATSNDFRMVKLQMLVDMVKADRLNEEQYASSMSYVITMLSVMNGRTEGEYIEMIINNFVHITIEENPIWMLELIQPIIYALIKLLDVNREHGFTSKRTKSIVFNYLLFIARSYPYQYTDRLIERFVVHLYEWSASQVTDMSLKEWTDTYTNTGNENEMLNLNDEEEQCSGIRSEKEHDQQQQINADSSFQCRFLSAHGNRAKDSIYKQSNLLLGSQLWNEKYAALVGFANSCKYLNGITLQQFQIILNSALKLVNDASIQVRWASLQCLVQLSQHKEFIKSSREEIFRIGTKTIRHPNERVQSSSCLLLQSMIHSLTVDNNTMVTDDVLDGLCRSFEILLQSSKLYVVENVLLSLMTVAGTVKKGLKPNFRNIIPILLSVLEKHQRFATKESRLLRCRAIKTFTLCSKAMNKKTYSKYMYKFMLFVGKNEGSVDLVDDFLRVLPIFIKHSGKSLAVYLPIIIKMIVQILEIPLPNLAEEMTESSRLGTNRIATTLIQLNIIMRTFMFGRPYLESVGQQLAPFVHCLFGPLLVLARCPNAIRTLFQIDSFHNLSSCLNIVKMHYGVSNEKALEMFGMIFELVLPLCLIENDWRMLDHRVRITNNFIIEMENEMSFDQVQSTIDMFYKLETRMEQVAQQVLDGNQDVIGNFDTPDVVLATISKIVVGIYDMLGKMVKNYSAITVPLITQDLLDRSCEKLRDVEESNIAKAGILMFMYDYCHYGGELAISSFPQIIPAILECLTTTDSNVRQNALMAVDEAAQHAKDRFSPLAMDVLQGLNAIVLTDDKSITGYATNVMATIIRYVQPQPSGLISIIIPKWLDHILSIYNFSVYDIAISNLCAIVRLYPNECLGQEYQHVDKLHQIIPHYIKKSTQQQQEELLTDTWLFIKDTIKSNWHNIPQDIKDTLSQYYKQ
ncbi:hypothetical protein DFA_00495 [Cavenderia fasciculata]|uniref:HEAT repeat-containing protein n=1 Tax=Cavenderia fasciculata TaxID=261658 RepID=F4PS36_CACFS|nr:uncharacterized protein DFA_00495 [Cavenderia fasciculata]EGG20634.1 hypothetical protein DFA_00495 [Cavenderia fasciculata]|eukprot:XP_004358484.1 hypothetical protein DFA_00495 [Cavenderia fasciculata]